MSGVAKPLSFIVRFLALILALTTPAMGGSDDATRRAIEWVNGLAENCAREDAYQCDARPEDDLLSPEADAAMISGAMLKAWQVTLADFKANEELSFNARDLGHYKFAFTQDNDNYIVLYRALLLPEIHNGQPAGILRTSIGRTTKYWVNKTSYEITKRLYLR